MNTKQALLGVAGVSAGILVVAGATLAAPSGSAARVQQVSIVIVGEHGAERASPSGNRAVAPGVPVRVTITNRTHEFHTFTVPRLNLSVLVPPARGTRPGRTSFTFTTYEWGAFRWYCVVCTGNAHGRSHRMGGTFYAIVDPSILP